MAFLYTIECLNMDTKYWRKSDEKIKEDLLANFKGWTKVSSVQGMSTGVFYGVLIPLVVIVAALILCIVVIVVKSKSSLFKNSVEDLKPTGSSVVIQTTDSLLSRKSTNGTKRPTMDTIENGIVGMTNLAFVPDALPETGGEDGDTGKTEQMSTTSTEDNDVHPRSLHSDLNMDEFGYLNMSSTGMYTAVQDLSKAGIDEDDASKDGDIGNSDSTDNNSKDWNTSDEPEYKNVLFDEPIGNDLDKATKEFSEDNTDPYLNPDPDIPTPDYVLDDAQSQEMTWVVPATTGQLESEISEVLLTPDYIENVSLRSASSESPSAGTGLQIDGSLESTGTTDGNQSDSNSTSGKDQKDDNDEDNRLPNWASEALQPTIRPMLSRDDFRSHLESLMSSPPQLPPSKTVEPPVPSLTPSQSAQSLVTPPEGKAPAPPPPPPPPQVPSSSTEEVASTNIPPAPTMLPPPLPPIQIMATHL